MATPDFVPLSQCRDARLVSPVRCDRLALIVSEGASSMLEPDRANVTLGEVPSANTVEHADLAISELQLAQQFVRKSDKWAQFSVDPARLSYGSYSHDNEKETAKGDIVGSYSADRIAEDGVVRKPFLWRDSLWVCVSIQSGGNAKTMAEAYRLSLASSFPGVTTTFARKLSINAGDYARNDPRGFYHGMTVKLAGESMALTGPPVMFVADDAQRATEQLELFG